MRSRLTAAVLVAAVLTAALPSIHVGLGGPVDVRGQEIETALSQQRVLALPFEASHVALRWTGAPEAHLTIAFGATQGELGEPVEVVVDDDAEGSTGEVSSGVIWTGGARFARVTTDRTVASLKVLAMDAGHARPLAIGGTAGLGAVADAAVSMPPILSRAAWGADESLRFNSGGYELFAPHFNTLQKVIVHHTAGRNDDPDPEATIRAIYYMHAVTRGYGDIDYNFLIDWQGRIYEGRHARDYAPGEPITGEDFAGNVVRGSHAKDFNDGTVGIALLGNFTKILPPAAQRAALEKLIAWKLERHGINPLGASTYTNSNLGNSKYLNNISGHRDVNATSCPGSTFYSWFGTLRQNVANRIAATTGSSVDHTAPGVISLRPMVPETSGATAMRFGLLFKEPVTALTASDFDVGGTSPGWTVGSVTGTASAYEVTVIPATGGKLPDEGTVTLTLHDTSVRDLGGNLGPGAEVRATTHYVHDDVPPTVILYQTPHRTASNAEYFDWTATFSEPVLGFTKSDIQLGGPDADEWYIKWLLGQDASYEFLTSQEVKLNGTFTVALAEGAVTDLAGNPSVASKVVTIKSDRSAPSTNGARTSLRSGTPLSGTSERVNVAWTGTDSGPAGISTYDVARSVDGQAFLTFASGLTATSLNTLLALGHTYRFETRARDKAGNVGAWRAGPTLTPSLVQQTSSGIRWSGAGATSTSASFSGGSERHLAAAGASASYTATARSLSFITTRASNRGVVKVYVDGVLEATVDLASPDVTYRYVAFSKTWSSAGSHTIKVVAASSTRVDVDAFGVLR